MSETTIQDLRSTKSRLEYFDRENVKLLEQSVGKGEEIPVDVLRKFAENKNAWEVFAETVRIFKGTTYHEAEMYQLVKVEGAIAQ